VDVKDVTGGKEKEELERMSREWDLTKFGGKLTTPLAITGFYFTTPHSLHKSID